MRERKKCVKNIRKTCICHYTQTNQFCSNRFVDGQAKPTRFRENLVALRWRAPNRSRSYLRRLPLPAIASLLSNRRHDRRCKIFGQFRLSWWSYFNNKMTFCLRRRGICFWFACIVAAVVTVQILLLFYHSNVLLIPNGASENDSRLLPRVVVVVGERVVPHHIADDQLRLPQFKSKFFQQEMIHRRKNRIINNDDDAETEFAIERRQNELSIIDKSSNNDQATSTSQTTTIVLNCNDELTPRLLQENRNVWEFNETIDGVLPTEFLKDCQVKEKIDFCLIRCVIIYYY